MILTKKEIMYLIPHRDPFLFLDRCEIIEIGYKGIGFRLFTSNEFFFKGHFPTMPIVPGVILIEALAQTSGIVVSVGFENQKEKSVLLFLCNLPYNVNEYITNYDDFLIYRSQK